MEENNLVCLIILDPHIDSSLQDCAAVEAATRACKELTDSVADTTQIFLEGGLLGTWIHLMISVDLIYVDPTIEIQWMRSNR